ncbi:MAG: hypothetical protein AAF456_17720 [Planctomycetota bacterium]
MLKRSLIIGLLSLASSLAADSAGGQGVSVTRDGPVLSGFGEVDLEKTVELWQESEIADIERTMQLQVDQIISVLQLDENESRRLQVAVKGITAERIESGVQQIRRFAVKSQLVNAPEDEGEDFEFEPHNRLQVYGAGRAGDQAVRLQTYFETPLTEHPLWMRTLQNTLSEEKFERYQQYRVARHQAHLDAAIQAWIADLDSQLFLSTEQADQLRTLMSDQLSARVTPDGPASLPGAREVVSMEFDNNSLETVLSEAQIEHRRETFERNNLRTGVIWTPNQDN